MRATGIVIVLLIVTGCFAPALRAGPVQTGRLVGLVMDVNEARVAGATIRIESAQLKRVVRSDDEGKFEIEAPSGSYQITVEQPGFKKFDLPNFRVAAGTCELVNIHLNVAPPKLPLKVY